MHIAPTTIVAIGGPEGLGAICTPGGCVQIAVLLRSTLVALSGIVGVLAALGMPIGPGLVGGAVVTAAGFLGMTVDSLLGALIEGDRIGNQAVNLLATLAGAIVAAASTPLVIG